MNMHLGCFYKYYKPSWINGFDSPQGMDVDFNYLQAFEGICRDEFRALPHIINSAEIQKDMKEQNGISTDKLSKDIFDSVFKRTYTVEHVFNTDLNEFK